MLSPNRPDRLGDMLDELYNLDRSQLRRLAWEALLIADGPNKKVESVEGPIYVAYNEDGQWAQFKVFHYGED